MTDPWQSPGSGAPDQPAAPASPYGTPAPPYGAPAPPYGAYGQPYGAPAQQPYGGPAPWYGAGGGQHDGPLGEVRPTGRCILLFLVTFGIYGYVYNYKVHSEMHRHSARGVGGGVALVLTFLAGVAMPFVTSAEVGSLHARKGWPEPVRGWTGLWYVLPAAVGYVLLIVGVFAVEASAAPGAEPSDSSAVGFGVLALLLVAAAVAGAVTWFVKTNGALNRYWQAVREGRSPAQ